MSPELFFLTLPLLITSEQCTLTRCRGKGPYSHSSILCLNTFCILADGSRPNCTAAIQQSSEFGNNITVQIKDCPHGCEHNKDKNDSIMCSDQVRKIGKVQMLILVVGISCSGLVLVACMTHCYMRRTKAISDMVLENMNVVLINDKTDKDVESESHKTERDVILPCIHEHVDT